MVLKLIFFSPKRCVNVVANHLPASAKRAQTGIYEPNISAMSLYLRVGLGHVHP